MIMSLELSSNRHMTVISASLRSRLACAARQAPSGRRRDESPFPKPRTTGRGQVKPHQPRHRGRLCRRSIDFHRQRRRHLRRRRDLPLSRSTPNGPTPIRRRPASVSTTSRSARAAASSRSRPRPSPSAPPTRRSRPTTSKSPGSIQFPMVMGGIVPVVNIDGHQAGRTRPRRPDARRHLPRQGHQVGRSGDQEAQPER